MQEASSQPRRHVLFVDDDADVQTAARLLLERHDLRVSSARSPAEAWSVLTAEPVDLILLDLNFTRGETSGAEGFAWLGEVTAYDPQAAVVVVTGHSGVAVAVEAMRAGARDFVMKPWRNDRLVETLQRALAGAERRPTQAPAAGEGDPPLLGDSPAFARVREVIRRAAATEAAVLICGPAGCGKSLMARTLHRQSARAAGPLLTIDLAALSAEAAAAALFGEAGAPGALDVQGATVLLDEVAALSVPLQARLIERLKQSRARLLATSRQPPQALAARGGLSPELLYRLNTVEVVAPSLEERPGDAQRLAEHFLRLYALRHGRPARPLTEPAAAAIAAHPWPGDVRALRQAMERCVIFCEGPGYALADIPFPEAQAPATGLSLAQSERAMLSAALKSHGFNVSRAAKQLGLTRAALYRRMAKHGL